MSAAKRVERARQQQAELNDILLDRWLEAERRAQLVLGDDRSDVLAQLDGPAWTRDEELEQLAAEQRHDAADGDFAPTERGRTISLDAPVTTDEGTFAVSDFIGQTEDIDLDERDEDGEPLVSREISSFLPLDVDSEENNLGIHDGRGDRPRATSRSSAGRSSARGSRPQASTWSAFTVQRGRRPMTTRPRSLIRP